ncbi:MAG: LysR family transcriptional regulator [Thermoleophilia bacterium]|nr:LysR family transcriptional regulator [Thermoleophilia bacterium]
MSTSDATPADDAAPQAEQAPQQAQLPLNPQHFGTFLAVVDAGGRLSAAARTLGLSQPGITHQLNELEKRLGTRLLDRGRGRSAKLTRAGSVFERYARSIVGLQSALYADLEQMNANVGGHLRVGATPALGEQWLPPLLHGFHDEFPDVHVEMRLSGAATIVDDVFTHDLELGFVGGTWARAGLQFDAVWEDRIVLVAAPTHPLAVRANLTFEDLRGAPFVAQSPGASLRGTFETELAQRGLTLNHFDVQAELGNQESVKSAVASGWGIGCVWQQSIHMQLALGTLVVLDVEGFAPEASYYVVHRTNRRLSRRGQALLEFIRRSRELASG